MAASDHAETPVAGSVRVNATDTANSRLYILPGSDAYASSSHTTVVVHLSAVEHELVRAGRR